MTLIKSLASFVCFSIGIGLTIIILGRPALEPLVSTSVRCFIAGILFVMISLVIVKCHQHRQLIFYVALLFAINAIVSLIVCRFWIDSVAISLLPPNILANHYGWGGEMAEEGLIIEMYFILLMMFSGFEGCVFWIINLLNKK